MIEVTLSSIRFVVTVAMQKEKLYERFAKFLKYALIIQINS